MCVHNEVYLPEAAVARESTAPAASAPLLEAPPERPLRSPRAFETAFCVEIAYGLRPLIAAAPLFGSPRLRSPPLGKGSPPGSVEPDDPPLPLLELPDAEPEPEPDVGVKKGGRSGTFP